MGLLDDEELLRRPAFGVFPQMQPRRRFQDPVGAANVPLDVTRGRLAGLLGLLPDALNFMGRSPMPTEMFGETQYEPTQQLPYGSEYYLQNLPLKPTARIGEVAGQAGAFVPLNPMPAARAVAAGAKALGPTAVGMGERYLQRQGLMPGVVPETPGLLGSIEKPQAPVSELGFYSATEQAALNIPRKSGTGESFLNDLMKGQDVKKDELSWMGLDDYLKGKPNVTRQEVQDFIASNRVDVREVRLGEPSNINKFSDVQLDAEHQRMFGTSLENDYGPDWRTRRQDIIDELANPELESNISGATKYQQYQLPGGENYREILLTLPKQSLTTNDIATKLFGKEMRYLSEAEKDAVIVEARRIEDTTPKDYTSSHFNEPNILAHMRVNDRVDADGKKMLLIEEIQSDWHQAGREKGYAPKDAESQLALSRDRMAERGNEIRRISSRMEALNDSQLDEFNMLAKERQNLQDLQGQEMDWGNKLYDAKNSGVPDAPFKDTWHQLALKRALKYAADNGYDRVGLTTGRQQAERYNLAKQVDYIDYVREGPDKYRMAIVGKDGQGVNLPKDIFSEVELKSYLGNDVAKRIVNGEGQRGGGRMTLRGPDLQVGGEGMKKYYDEIYPAFLAKQGKKYNAKTGETNLETKKSINLFGVKPIPGKNETVRYIDISPEMRGGVKKGQPLFTAAPIGGIGLGAGTQDNEMPDAVRQYMANPTLGLLQDEEERKKLGGLLFR